jgi:alkaline phosphatase
MAAGIHLCLGQNHHRATHSPPLPLPLGGLAPSRRTGPPPRRRAVIRPSNSSRINRLLRGAGLALALAVLALALVAYALGYRPVLVRPAPFGDPGPPLDFAPRPGGERLDDGPPAGARPSNVVLIVGDGMGFSQILAARAEIAGVNGRLCFERFPFTAWTTTHSLDRLYTDSAAAATALASGVKTRPRMLGLTPDGRSHPTVLEAVLGRGGRAGLITTTTVFDATPAAFVAHVASRYDTEEVARQMAAAGVELLVGQALPTGSRRQRARAARVRETFAAAGYRWVESWPELGAEPGGPAGPVIAQLPPGVLDTPARTLPLAEVAGLALDRFAGSPEGFFLLVEDEDSDTGSHRADLPRVVAAVRALDGVARRAVEFARGDGATLVLVTADHETGGLTIREGGAGEPADYLWATDSHTALPVPLFAYGPGAERFRGVLDNTEVPRILADLLGLELPAGG